MKIVVLYVRSSSQESQRRQQNSIPAQKTRLEEWARRDGATVVKIFEDKDTGKDFLRPGFKDMWAYVRNNSKYVTHVLCTEVTRFGREGAEFLKWFKKYADLNVEVNFIDEWFNFGVPETYSLFYFRIGNAESESRRIGKRTKDIKQDIRQRGYYADTPPAPWVFGPRDEAGRKPLVANEPMFTMYRQAIGLMLNGGILQSEAAAKVSTDLCRIPTSTFSRLLRNPLLAGYIPIYNESRKLVDVIPGKVEPLITWTQFQQMQDLLRVRAVKCELQEVRKLHMSFNPDFPVKQLLRCPECGAGVRAYWARGRHGGRYGYYDCGSHYRVNISKANAALVNVLNIFQVKPSEQDIMAKAADKAMVILGLSSSRRKEALSKALAEAQQRIIKLKSDYMKLDGDIFSDLMKEAKAAERSALAQLESIDNSATLAIDVRAKLLRLIDNLGDWWREATAFQQYECLRMIFPAGFSLENGTVRTPRVNVVLSAMCCFVVGYITGKEKSNVGALLFLEADASGKDFETHIEGDLVLVQSFLKAVA